MSVEHAVGSQLHPMSDQQLVEKFMGQTEGILPTDRSRQLLDLCWKAWSLQDAGEIGRMGASA